MAAPKKNRMALCHPDRPHDGRDLCEQCYGRLKRSPGFVAVGRAKTGLACGHDGRRNVGHGMCPSCYAKHLRETKEKYSKGARASEEMQRRYGITAAQRDEFIRQQGGGCRLCGKILGANCRPHIDHCHHTGAIRGILCSGCNQSLGKFGDSVEGLERAIAYLKMPPLLFRKAEREAELEEQARRAA